MTHLKVAPLCIGHRELLARPCGAAARCRPRWLSFAAYIMWICGSATGVELMWRSGGGVLNSSHRHQWTSIVGLCKSEVGRCTADFFDICVQTNIMITLIHKYSVYWSARGGAPFDHIEYERIGGFQRISGSGAIRSPAHRPVPHALRLAGRGRSVLSLLSTLMSTSTSTTRRPARAADALTTVQ